MRIVKLTSTNPVKRRIKGTWRDPDFVDPESKMIPLRTAAAWERWRIRSKGQEPIVEIPAAHVIAARKKAAKKNPKSKFILKPRPRKKESRSQNPESRSQKWYVGNRSGSLIMFQSSSTPTQSSHGHLYSYAIGPFKTKLGATIMEHHGKGNPHLQTVDDAERFASKGVSWLLAQGFHV